MHALGFWFLAGSIVLVVAAHCFGDEDLPAKVLGDYNVAWTRPSKDSSESMPCGGGDIGLNVWVEKGDVLFYIHRSGSFDENNEYLKLGRVRITLSPNPFADGGTFRQELDLLRGHVVITGRSGPDGPQTRITVWVEVHRPVIHVDVAAEQPVEVVAAYEGWRNEDTELPNDGKNSRFGCFSWDQYPGKVVRYRDTVAHEGGGVLFVHRNRDDKLLFDYMVRQQKLEAVKDGLVNTQKGRTFGGLLTGSGLVEAGTAEGKVVLTPYRSWRLKSTSAARQHTVKVYTHVAQTPTLADWREGLERLVKAKAPSDADARRKTQEWWRGFWSRSWIAIRPDKPNPADKAWQIARNYQLFRYQLGCNAYGAYPTKFNGGNFTFDPSLVDKRRRHTPDWRAWGGGSFTAQNQRLVYWPMLKSGDFDMMAPQFEFYRRALPNATARVKAYWGHGGCLFTEQMENFALPIACAWGWTEPGARSRKRPKDFELGVQVNRAVGYHYEAQLEFSYMILQYHAFTGEDISKYLPFIERSVRFFDEHYQMRCTQRTGKPLDENGKLVIHPSTSCESYRGATNPSDLLAGLNACLKGLLALDAKYTTQAKRAYWRAFLQRVPPYGIRQVKGRKIMKPAWSWSRYQNCECPQFYPLFPFDQFFLGRSDMRLFRDTWAHGGFRKGLVISWHQDGIFFARMGLTAKAADYNVKKLQDSGRRFPTFWGPGHDWVPDHNWGGSGIIGLQEMLLQTDGRRILVLPAWPKAWDVDFKLHAPGRTVVRATVRGGKLSRLVVTPPARQKDVEVLLAD